MTTEGGVMADILVIGGYGAVGAGVSVLLDEWFPGRVIAAGRRPDAATLPATIRRARLDLADPASLGRLLDTHAIEAAVLCVEPADATVAATLLDRGIHLIDIGATDGLHRQVEALHDRAVAAGATGVLSVGLAPGLTNLLARRASEEVGGATAIDITVMLGAGERHGADAVAWTVAGLGRETADTPRRVAMPGHGVRSAFPMDFSDQHSLRRTLGTAVTTRMCLDSALSTALLAGLRRLGVFRAARRWPAVRRLVTAALSGIHLGGDAYAIRVDAVNGDRRATLTLGGNSQSRVTALVAAHVTRTVLTGVLPAGVHHVDQLPALAALPETAGLPAVPA
ncbi:saccharopine dehydrogenase [Actinoplanes sp. NPDC051851]|uniref:saccharopine dehydrogenase family protein n=1 Tax=Actinoplanes sp. NPDC051851 TaxID=3154753 RepID=UPI00343FEA3E